jgi:hypothetical protein
LAAAVTLNDENVFQPPDPSMQDDARELSASFQTAGKGNVISVSEEDVARASKLLNDSSTNDINRRRSFGTSSQANKAVTSADNLGSLEGADAMSESTPSFNEALQAGPTIPRETASSFQTAGTGTAISVTEASLATASALLNGGVHTADQGHSPTSFSEMPVIFQTAGKGKAISVSEKSVARANALLRDNKTVADADEIMAPAAVPHLPATFQTAGKGNSIVATEDGIARANEFWETSTNLAECHAEKSQPEQFLLPIPIPAVPMFQTAGKKTTIAVTEDMLARAESRLHEASSNSSEQTPNLAFRSTSNQTASRQTVAYRTAGEGNAITVSEEAIVRGSALLQGMPASGQKEAHEESPRDVSVTGGVTTASFQTARQGTTRFVTEDSMVRANEVLQGTTVGGNREQPSQRTCHAAEKKFEAVEMRETLVGTAHATPGHRDDGSVANSREDRDNASKQYESLNDYSHGLITQPLPPETPLVLNQRDGSEQCQEKESFHIARVAFGLTPQSQSSCRDETVSSEVPDRQQAQHEDSNGVDESSGSVFPAVTPSSRMGATMQKSSERALKHPAFTPKQTPMETTNAVTMSFDPQNPYLRKRHNSPSASLSEKGTYSPVPINFRHVEGSFRGKAISPTSISHAEAVLAGRGQGTSSSRVLQPQKASVVDAHESTARGTRTKKMVTWSEDNEQARVRSTLSGLASSYGKLEDCVDVCRDAGVHEVTLAVDSNNASRVRFDSEKGLPCSFFGQPCPPSCKPVGAVRDFRQSLVERGCDEKILTDKWISNHLRWIVWKLASTERRFAFWLAQSYLTYDHVATQLYQRYEKELKGGNRSALRKVLNRDVAASSMMILCISQIYRQNKRKDEATKGSTTHREWMLELTDGWYSIGGVVDDRLGAFVSNGKIKVGSKLLVCNAKLEGPEDGIDPLDTSYSSSGRNCSAALSLIINGTRLAKWDAKMGFVKPCGGTWWNRGSLLVRSISHIVPGGGDVPLIDLVVCRLYPLMFLEKSGTNITNEMLEKLGGKSPVISEAQEYKNRMKFEKQRHQAMERLSETVQSECTKVRQRELLEDEFVCFAHVVPFLASSTGGGRDGARALEKSNEECVTQ